MEQAKPNLGEHEMEVLRYIDTHGPVAARDVVEAVGPERSLARTTVLTVVERLRKKGYLKRKRNKEGVFVYTSCEPQAELMQDLVRQFVEKMLGGAVSPVVAYLASVKRLPDEDLAEMQKLVEELKAGKAEEKP
jgi:predicted transcriptional regulator